MSQSKGAAKAAPAKKRARKVKTEVAKKQPVVAEHLLVPVDPGDWPSNLSTEDAERLFEFVEEGGFLYQAAAMLGIKKSTLSQWRKRHKLFGARLDEAEEIGREFLVEEINEFADDIFDRDSAAAAKEKRENRMEIVRAKWPQKYRTSPFKPSVGGGDGAALLGVVLVPMKANQTEERPAIEGSAVRVPMKALAP